IVPPPSLASSLAVWPLVVNEGQNITVVMTVSNTSMTAPATFVSPTQLFKSGTGYTTPANPLHSPVSATVAPNTAQEFTWVVQAVYPGGAGDVSWAGWATGQDMYSGLPVYSAPSSTAIVTIEQPAILSKPDVAAPSKVSVGQLFTVTMTVTNSGDGDVTDLVPNPNPISVIPIGTAGGSAIPEPLPGIINPVSLAGHSSVTFTWTYSATSAGTINVSGNVTGIDNNSGNIIKGATSGYATVIIQNAAKLASNIYVNPPLVYNGQLFTVSLVVTNIGQAAALDVSATTMAIDITSVIAGTSAMCVSGPLPVSTTVNGGATVIFRWTYTAYGEGLFTFSSNALGLEGNTGADLATIVTGATLTLNASAALSSDIWISDTGLAVGQDLTIRMTVTNTGVGTADATYVEPMPATLTRIGSAPFTYISGPTGAASPLTLTVGSSATFEWVYRASGTGTSVFSVITRGIDNNSGNLIYSMALNTFPVTVETMASLAGAISVSQTVVNVGQEITVIMTVTNNGTGDSLNTNITWGATRTGTGEVVAITQPSGLPVTMAGGTDSSFTWTFSSTAPGIFSFTADATGTDENMIPATQVTTGVRVSNNVTVNAPAELVSGVSLIPGTTISETQTVTVVLSVTNTGTSAAMNVAPYLYTMSGETLVSLLSTTPAAVTITGGTTANFTWVYNTLGQGIVVFTSFATGALDKVSGAPATITAVSDTATLTITEKLPSLVSSIAVTAPTDPANLNQFITVVMTVSNVGIVAAMPVTPYMDMAAGPLNPPAATPAPVASIPVNGTATFTWIYQNNGTAGVASFTVHAEGMSQGSSTMVNSTDNGISTGIITVAPSGSNLTGYANATGPALPGSCGIGEVITVILTVTNIGQTQADAVVPMPVTPTLTSSSTGTVSVLTGPDPLSVAAIAPDGSATFTWTFSATGGGNVEFLAGAEWNDVGVGGPYAMYVTSTAVNIANGVTQATTQNYMRLSANSFNPLTGGSVDIIFSVAVSGDAAIMVFNVAGQRVRTMTYTGLVTNILYTQQASWDGRADDGQTVTNGLYYIKLRSGSYETVKTVAVMKK
ncbi:MAG: hypothetical protein LLG37_00230, partial [Spirochaetia bacterium]|nr:hypothetical protein [Spirochaetia bacterium]